ncbi:MAG: DUF4349 domain-containing protein [Anaerolineae bacterium]|nr:DUF4349 domain-containing protein [Anaerolineae bacterium]
MALKARFFNPVTLVIAAVVVIALVIAVGSFGGSRMAATPPMSDVTGSLGGEGYNYASAPGNQPVVAQEAQDRFGTDDVLPADSDGTAANVQDGRTRVILKSASLRLVVDAADSSLAAITSMAEEMGGWVVTSNTSMVTTAAGQSVAQGSITIRVPSDKLDEALSQIKSGAGKVEYENVSGQDVTQQYVDLSSRLTNLEAAEVQLRSIMDEARKTEDVLSVYNQLVSTRGEIEQIRGQLQYYDEASAYSSISVDLIPTAIYTPIQIAGWSPGHTVENALATLVNILQSVADLIITVVVLIVPLGLFVLIPLWFARRLLRRRAARSISPA